MDKKFISEHELDQIIIDSYIKRPIAEILIENGYEPTLVGINISRFISRMTSKYNFRNIKFIDCNFTDISKYPLQKFLFDHCTFKYTIFKETTINKNTSLNGCVFQNCVLSDSFIFTQSSNITFQECGLSNCHLDLSLINNANIQDCKISASHLKGPNSGNTLLKCSIQDTVIDKSINLEKSNTFTNKKAKHAFLVNFNSRGLLTPLAQDKIADQDNSAVIAIEQYSHSISKSTIYSEMIIVQDQLKSTTPSNQKPIPQLIIDIIKSSPDTFYECNKLLLEAKEIASQVDSIFIPGNNQDVPLLFYDDKANMYHKDIHFNDDYRLPLKEIFLINEAFQKGIPIMGVCHGFQMINIFFGGQLYKNVKNQMAKRQRYTTPNTPKKPKDPFNFNNMIGIAMHHQGVIPQEMRNENYLEENLIYEGMVKASSPSKGGSSPIIATQFHPELYETKIEITNDKKFLNLSKQNQLFWDAFNQAAQTHKNKQSVLKYLKKSKQS